MIGLGPRQSTERSSNLVNLGVKRAMLTVLGSCKVSNIGFDHDMDWPEYGLGVWYRHRIYASEWETGRVAKDLVGYTLDSASGPNFVRLSTPMPFAGRLATIWSNLDKGHRLLDINLNCYDEPFPSCLTTRTLLLLYLSQVTASTSGFIQYFASYPLL